MARGPSGALRTLRWGVFLLLAGSLLAVLVPGLLDGVHVTVLDERAAVPTLEAWSLPALDVSLSMPPESGSRALATWAAEQLAAAVYALAVLGYYAGLAGLAVGAVLVGLALHRFYRSADALGR